MHTQGILLMWLVLVLPAAGFAPVRRSIAAGGARLAALDAAVGGGSYVALITPFLEDGEMSIDVESFDALLDWHLAEGTDGLVVLGTTGESATVTPEERQALIERAVARVDGRAPVMIGTGTYSTRTSIEQTVAAMRAGADAALVVTPYYNKPPQDSMVAHFTAVADAVVQTAKAEGLPVMPLILYNVPGRTGCDMKPETVATLAKHEAIKGLKDATGEIDRLALLRQGCGDDFLLYCGEDALACDWTLQGGDGVISVTANVCPKAMADVMRLAAEGAHDEAKQLDGTLELLHARLFCTTSPIPAKWTLSRMGRIPTPNLRLPLLPLGAEHQGPVEEAAKAGGAL